MTPHLAQITSQWFSEAPVQTIPRKRNVLIIKYVDDTVIILPNKDQILKLIKSLQADSLLRDDSNLHDYLAVRFVCDRKKVTMYQPKMTHLFLEELSMLLPDNHKNKIRTHNSPC